VQQGSVRDGSNTHLKVEVTKSRTVYSVLYEKNCRFKSIVYRKKHVDRDISGSDHPFHVNDETFPRE
jgi:hypothetical protein